jgi:hypothetical protein
MKKKKGESKLRELAYKYREDFLSEERDAATNAFFDGFRNCAAEFVKWCEDTKPCDFATARYEKTAAICEMRAFLKTMEAEDELAGR